MPDVLTPVRPTPPANEAVIGPNGDQHSQAWTQYHKSVSDWIAAQNDKGASDGTEAAPGDIGEFLTASLAHGVAHPMTSGVPIDVAWLDLTAGDWDVWGNIVFFPSGAATISIISGWVAPSSATIPGALESEGYVTLRTAFTAGAVQGLPIGRVRLLTTTTQRLYLTGAAVFGAAGVDIFGTLNARRMR